MIVSKGEAFIIILNLLLCAYWGQYVCFARRIAETPETVTLQNMKDRSLTLVAEQVNFWTPLIICCQSISPAFEQPVDKKTMCQLIVRKFD